MIYTDKARIIVVFADLRGSSRWGRRIADNEERRSEFMADYDKEGLAYKKETGAHFYKRLGDGRMIVHEIDKTNQEQVAAVCLIQALGFIKRVDHIISRFPSPRPTGFRVRMLACQRHKEIYGDREEDYFGYGPSACHEFLKIHPDISLVIHESVMELVPPKEANKLGLSYKLLRAAIEYPDKVDKEDVEALYSVEMKRSAR
jgi:hypothetical protein